MIAGRGAIDRDESEATMRAGVQTLVTFVVWVGLIAVTCAVAIA